MDFQDRPLQCLDCKNEFIFTAGEQEFYERKGFKEIPKRCKPCRDARKTRRTGDGNGYSNGNGGNGYHGANGNGNDYGYSNGNNGYGNGGYGSGGHGNSNGNGSGNGSSNGDASGNRGSRAGREMFDATCASCGAPARVPFRPATGRPVYCRDCYTSRQGQGSGYGGGY